jgi:hypothetical protein
VGAISPRVTWEVSPSSRLEAHMTQPSPGRGGRVLGKSLLTLANVITAAAPLAADCWTARWSDRLRRLSWRSWDG